MSYWKRRQEETYKAGEMTVNQYFTKLEKRLIRLKEISKRLLKVFIGAMQRKIA